MLCIFVVDRSTVDTSKVCVAAAQKTLYQWIPLIQKRVLTCPELTSHYLSTPGM